MWDLIIAASENQEGDAYDYLGRNISAQKRRQELEPWHIVVYHKSSSKK